MSYAEESGTPSTLFRIPSFLFYTVFWVVAHPLGYRKQGEIAMFPFLLHARMNMKYRPKFYCCAWALLIGTLMILGWGKPVFAQMDLVIEIPDNVLVTQPTTIVSVPIQITHNGHLPSSAVFTINFDQACLSVNPADTNFDAIPDAVVMNPSLSATHFVSVGLDINNANNELSFLIMDMFAPLAIIPSGTLATINFTRVCDTELPLMIRTTPVEFGAMPPVSFGSTTGGDIPYQALNGSVLIERIPITINNPTAPTFNPVPAACGTYGSIVIPTQAGVIYKQGATTVSGTLTGLQGSQTITAEAAPGYILTGTTSWTQNLGTHIPCATPVAPTFTPIAQCNQYGTIQIPAVTGVIYVHNSIQYTTATTLSNLQGSHTVTAIPASGYQFPSGATTSWTQNLQSHTTCATPIAPTFTTIAACGQYGSINIPAATGVVYTHNSTPYASAATISNLQGNHTVTAAPAAGYSFPPSVTVTSWSSNLGAHTTCATPAAPTFNAIAACGQYGTIDIPAVAGVIYVHNSTNYPAATTLTNLQGSHTVTAIAATGYSFPVGTQTSWTGNLGTHTTCATPTMPSHTPIAACGQYGSIGIPAVTGVIYVHNSANYPAAATISNLEGSQTVTAIPAAGHSFPAGATTSWTFSLGTHTDCAIPIAPNFTPISACDMYGSISLTAAAGVTYHHAGNDYTTTQVISGLSGNQMVTVTADAGYSFPPATTTSWSANLGTHRTCVEATPPTFVTITACNMYGQVIVPTITGVIYSVTPNGANEGPVVVSATAANANFELVNYTGPWSEDLGTHFACPPDGTPVTPQTPTVTPITQCNQNGVANLPVQEGVIYAVSPLGATQGAITITATPDTDYYFPDGSITSWNFNLGTFTTCATPIAPTFNPIVACGTYGSVTLPNVTGVDYAITDGDGQEGAATVTATPQSGYSFPPSVTVTSWSSNLGTRTTCATPLSPTFNNIAACGQFGSIDIPAVTGVIYVHDSVQYASATTLTNLQGSHTVTAVAAAGYSFPSGALASWTGNLGAHTDCATPAMPSHTTIALCGQYGTIGLPAATGVVYVHNSVQYTSATTLSNLEGSQTVTAVPASGYSFPAGAIASWTFNLGTHTDCATPAAPTFNPITACGVYGSVDFPTVTGVTYAITSGDGQEGAVTVTATPQSGYSFPTGVITTWSTNLGERTECATPIAPAAIPIAECNVFGAVIFPDVEGVQYAIVSGDGLQGNVTVEAFALAGYDFPSGATTQWVYDLGVFALCPGEIGNLVWNDTNGNGTQDPDELGISGILVELYRVNDGIPGASPILTTTTDGLGNYTFSNLSTNPGMEEYQVRFVLPQGYGFTTRNFGSDFTDSDADPVSGKTHFLSLGSSEEDPSLDAGIYRAAIAISKETLFNEEVKGKAVSLRGDSLTLPYNSNGANWNVQSRFTISNQGTVILSNLRLTDDLLGDIACSALNTPLAPGASVVCNATSPYENNNVTNTGTIMASVAGRSASPHPTDHAQASDSSGYVCKGNELYGRWYYETSDTFNGFTPGQDFLFKDAPDTLVPDALKQLALPVFLSRAGQGEAQSRVVVSQDGLFQLSNLDVGTGMTYTLRVADDALTPLGYGPIGSSLRPDILASDCESLHFDIGYTRASGAIGGNVWYDANSNGERDEWFDADNDGQITQNNDPDSLALDENGYVSFSLGDFEFIDMNGNNLPDLEGEVNSCGLRSVGPQVELFDREDETLASAIAGNSGYYRFRSALQNGVDSPLDPAFTYGVRLLPEDSNPLLVTGATEMATSQRCKTRPDVDLADTHDSVAGATDELKIPYHFDGSPFQIDASGTAPANGAGEVLVCGSTTVPSMTRRLADYDEHIAMDAHFGVVCMVAADAGLDVIWLPVVSTVD